MAKAAAAPAINLGRVLIFRGLDAKPIDAEFNPDERDVCEILDVTDDNGDTIRAGFYLLPKADAKLLKSDDGLVYAYNVGADYLAETAHLAKVEENIIVSQAFLYQGRNQKQNGLGLSQWIVFGVLAFIAFVAILAH